MDDTNFNVMDMLEEYADDQGVDPADIFKKSEPVKKPEPVPVKKEEPIKEMPEENQMGVVIDMDDLVNDEGGPLLNNADEDLKVNGELTIDRLKHKTEMLEKAKRRWGVKNLHIPDHIVEEKIPDGALLKSEFLMAAENTNEEAAQAALDAVFAKLQDVAPGTIEYIDSSKNSYQEESEEKPEESSIEVDDESLKVVIDKRDVNDVTWNEEDLDKIRKSRTIELNIVEKENVEFGNVKRVRGNAIDNILAPFKRKSNDIVKALPASKYRATFTGLTYPEVLDLAMSTSKEMTSFDSEMKKWTIAYNHTENPSIGPWKEYLEYIDPNTGNRVPLPVGSDIPPGVSEDAVYRVTMFDDFMRHTSFLDLEYILWNILCATTMETEIITIRCRNQLPNGNQCNNRYEWLYKPAELLSLESIPEEVFEDIQKASDASGKEEIDKVYKSSFVADDNEYFRLTSSGFYVFYGHASAYNYMDNIFGRLEAIGKASNEETVDPTIVSKTMVCAALQIVKKILIKQEDGSFAEVDDADGIMRVLETLDEIDWKTLNELSNMLIKPYQFKYSIKGITCKKCNTKSSIPIATIGDLLFIVAQSLQSVQVKLTKT